MCKGGALYGKDTDFFRVALQPASVTSHRDQNELSPGPQYPNSSADVHKSVLPVFYVPSLLGIKLINNPGAGVATPPYPHVRGT